MLNAMSRSQCNLLTMMYNLEVTRMKTSKKHLLINVLKCTQQL